MSSAADPVRFISPSAIKQWVRCPRSSTVKTESNAPMRAGTLRHALIAGYYRSGLNLLDDQALESYAVALPLWQSIDAGLQAAVIGDVRAAAKKPGFLPDPDLVLSCEASDIPALFSYRFTDRETEEVRELVKFCLFDGNVPVKDPEGKEVYVRCAWDLAFVDPAEPDTLVFPDWKGRTEEEEEVAAAFYALGGARIWPGYNVYRFETRHLGSNRISDPYNYPVKDLPEIEGFIVGLVRKYLADPRTEEKPNRYCGGCALNANCDTYLRASGQPIAPSVKQVKELPVPTEPAEIIRTYYQVKLTRTVAEAREEQLKQEVEHVLEAGELVVDGEKHFLGDHKGQKELLEAAAADFCETFDVPTPAISGIRRDLFELACAEKRTEIAPEIRKDFDEGLAACYAQKTSKVPKRKKVSA